MTIGNTASTQAYRASAATKITAASLLHRTDSHTASAAAITGTGGPPDMPAGALHCMQRGTRFQARLSPLSQCPFHTQFSFAAWAMHAPHTAHASAAPRDRTQRPWPRQSMQNQGVRVAAECGAYVVTKLASRKPVLMLCV